MPSGKSLALIWRTKRFDKNENVVIKKQNQKKRLKMTQMRLIIWKKVVGNSKLPLKIPKKHRYDVYLFLAENYIFGIIGEKSKILSTEIFTI